MGSQISLCRFHEKSVSKLLLEAAVVTLWDELTDQKASQKASFTFWMDEISFFSVGLNVIQRSLLGKCTSMYECNSQDSTFLFSDQFANTVFVKSAMRYFLAQWSLWWQRKYPQMKTRNKLSMKLLGDVWIHLTEFHLCFMKQAINTVFGETEKGYFGSHWGLRW